MSQLLGKVALVTGGSRGIGAEIAKRLANDGADVALTYVSNAERAKEVAAEVESAGRRAVAIEADMANPEDVTGAVEQAASELGGPDILVNNAGIFPNGPLEEVSLAELDHALAVHARAAFLAAQAVSRHMPDGGRIISIGSNLAEQVPGPGITLYSMSKAALSGLSRGLARDLGDRGITANVVHPGSTNTDMNPADSPAADGQRARTALGRYMDPADLAATVAHLAGPGGRNITGTEITVDAGANA